MTTIPEGAKAPQDHLSAVQREAEGTDTVTVEFDGRGFTIPADPQDWNVRTIAAFEDGKAVAGIRALLGEKAFRSAGIEEWPLRKAAALFDLLASAAGFGDSEN